MLIALMYLTEEYKRDQVSMKDQDSLWIISTLNWYYKFSKSIFTNTYAVKPSSAPPPFNPIDLQPS
jgi:hypothetical protein